MKRAAKILIIFLFVIAYQTVKSQAETEVLDSTYTIINTIPSPTTFPTDIAFDGQHIWVAGYNEYQLFKINPATGELITTIPVDIKRPYGITFENDYLYVLDNEAKQIVQLNPLDGEVVNTFGLGEAGFPAGLTMVNGEFWYNDTKGPQPSVAGDETVQLDAEGNFMNKFISIGIYPTGLAYDGAYLWSTDSDAKTIYAIDTEGFEIMQSIPAPGGKYPNGLTYGGESIWVINNESDSIYQISVQLPADAILITDEEDTLDLGGEITDTLIVVDSLIVIDEEVNEDSLVVEADTLVIAGGIVDVVDEDVEVEFEEEDVVEFGEVSAIEEQSVFVLEVKVAPNPVVNFVTVTFELVDESDVGINIYNINGQLVNNLYQGFLGAGAHQFTWNLEGLNKETVSDGLYFCQFRIDDRMITKKIMVNR